MIARRLCSLILVALLVGSSQADEPEGTYRADGPELFQAWFRLAGVTPITEDEYALGRHLDGNCILVVWGTDPGEGTHIRWPDTANAVLNKGGSVVFLSNERADLSWLSGGQTMIRIFGNSPVDTPVNGAYAVEWDRGLKQPFTTLQESMGVNARPLRAIGSPSPRRLVVRDRSGRFHESLAAIPALEWQFAIGGAGPASNPYRYLVFADQNVFSNAMLLDQRWDNYYLALNVVRFLQGPQKRSRCLFLDHGRIVESFPVEFATPPLPDVPLPLPGWQKLQTLLTETVNKQIERMEGQDLLNRSLLGRSPREQDRRLAIWLQTLAMIAAVFAVLYLLRKVWKSRHPQDPVLTSRFEAPATHSLIGRRGEEILRQDNLIELARASAREFLRDMQAPSVARADQLVVEFTQGEPTGLAKRIVRVWHVANDASLTRLAAKDWTDFERDLAAVREAAETKLWRFSTEVVAR